MLVYVEELLTLLAGARAGRSATRTRKALSGLVARSEVPGPRATESVPVKVVRVINSPPRIPLPEEM